MHPTELREALVQLRDPRFAEAARETLRVLEDGRTELRGGDRCIPRRELLTIYRARRDLKRAQGTPWPVLEAVVEAMEESTSASLRILYVHSPDRMNTAFVNDDGSVCACAAFPAALRPDAPL